MTENGETLDGGGDIWNNHSNADLNYHGYLRSKYTQMNNDKSDKSGRVDAEKLYLGKCKHKNKDEKGDDEVKPSDAVNSELPELEQN